MRSLLICLACLLVVGCAEKPLVSQDLKVEARVPYRLQLEFSSDVPDPYTVFSGPMETYDRFPVGTELETLLNELMVHQQSATAPEVAQVRFHFSALVTNFDQLGALPPKSRSLLASLDGTGDGGDLPSETWRGATLSARLTITVDGVERYEGPLRVDHQEVVFRDDYYPWLHSYRDRFDFGPLFGRLLHETVREVGDQIELSLAPRG